MFSHFFIDRPIFSIVVSIVISIAGLVAMVTLPIAQYPQITPIQIQVTANYPGANGTLVAQNVGAPIEQQVNGADNMIYMSSTSSSTGNYTLSVYFTIETDPKLAQVDVQNRVNLALAELPEAVRDQGVSVKQKTSTFLMILAFYSPDGRYDNDYIANYTNVQVLSAINRIPGANQTAVFGVPDYAMRIWLKPDRMAQLKISTNEVANAIKQQNQQFSIGRIGDSPTPYPVQQTVPVVAKTITEPFEFDNMILRAKNANASLVQVKDIGHTQLGAQSYSLRTNYNGKPATLIAVYQQPGANALQVSKDIRATLESMSKSFPQGLKYDIALDTTVFVQDSINEVIKTFFEAVLLVILVVFGFLHSMRLTIIPTLAVPVSILGAMIGMLLFGFSINMLTLFGMILAIGLVVDDAIVVVENTERNMVQFGLNAKAAAKKAMSEVSGPVIAVVLVLNAVFIPVAFLGGITGALYKQFAITIAISMLFSGVVALTLSPALAAILLEKKSHQKHRFFVFFDEKLEKITQSYASGIRWMIQHWQIALGLFALIILGALAIFKIMPTAFVPPEDQGYVFAPYFLPDSASLDRTQAVGAKVAAIFNQHPAVAGITQIDGYSLIDAQFKTNFGLLFVSLKDYAERTEPGMGVRDVLMNARQASFGIPEGLVMPINPPAIPGLGVTAGFQVWIEQHEGGDFGQLAEVVDRIIAKTKTRPELTGVNTTIRVHGQQLLADVDRDKAEFLGVPIQDVYSTLQTMFGSLYVSQFPKDSRLYQVVLQADPSYRMTPEDLDRFYVKSREGHMIPLSALVTARYVVGPDLVTRFNNYPAISLTGGAPMGRSSGSALEAMREVIESELPSGYGYEWSGEAREELNAGSTSVIAFLFGLLFVFLILAAQYESWSLPFSVMLAVPFAIFGALLAILLRGIPNDLYFQIGLLTLIGLAAKNAILIVEFAVELNRKEGMSFLEAAVNAGRLRLRPIIMTSFAFILGVLPLALATGASANSRHSIGTGVIGGTLLATVVAIFFIPLFYWMMETLSQKWFGNKRTENESSANPHTSTHTDSSSAVHKDSV